MVIETTGEGRARFNPNLYAGAPRGAIPGRRILLRGRASAAACCGEGCLPRSPLLLRACARANAPTPSSKPACPDYGAQTARWRAPSAPRLDSRKRPTPTNQTQRADGKVCLSLLGTFHGANAAEKWSPKDSSLYQILLSVQGLILIEVGVVGASSRGVQHATALDNVLFGVRLGLGRLGFQACISRHPEPATVCP